MQNDKSKSELRSTMEISTREGIFAQIYGTLAAPGSIFLTKFAVMLGATPFQFSLMAAIGQLSQIFQPLGVMLTRNLTSRKNIVIKFASASRALSFLFGFLPFMFINSSAMWIMLLIYFFSTSLGAVGGNAWIAWIADMVPLRIRGRFFSRRSQYLMVAGLLTGYTMSAFIDMYAQNPGFIAKALLSLISNASVFSAQNLTYAFLAIFCFGTIIGLLGLRILKKQPERQKSIERESFREMLITPLQDKNFRKLLLYAFWWMFAVGIGAPFWGPFLIQKLNVSLVEIQLYGTISTFASIAALRPWGFIIDRFGNKTAMRFSLLLGGMNPMLWLFVTPDSYWLIFVEAFTSGIMWSGAGIVATNFVLAIAPKGKQQIYSGIFGAFSGIAMTITMLMSGIFLPAPREIFGLHLEPEQVLFGLTGLARWSTQIPLTWIHEPHGKPVRAALYFYIQFALFRIADIAGWVKRKRK